MRHDSFRLYARNDQQQEHRWVRDGGFAQPLQILQAAFDNGASNPYIVAPHNFMSGTKQGWLELFAGLAEIASRKALARIHAELLLLVIGGEATRSAPTTVCATSIAPCARRG